ncbi:MAG: glycosyltransferase family 4 protein [Actinomycetota bacterium]|nr:glycosyltransferase family 4 protein [Actinomycetota bacterium]MDD5666513.1 glycosyltransferase family 4 protein [Actinomycetota bacterium]
MNVVILSWEYPPRIIGGLGTHVHQLAVNLARAGINIHVVTKDAPDAPDFEVAEGVQIHRVPLYAPEIPQEEWVPWTLQFNVALLERAIPLINERIGKVHVLHAHDWLVAHAAISLKHAYRIPLVATIHATEYGRHQGYIPEGMSRIIHQIEWWLTFESVRTITCSNYMRDEVARIFELPGDKITVIPNGIEYELFRSDADTERIRRQFVEPDSRMIFFVGRLVYEKGVQTVIEAMPRVLQEFPDLRFLVAGTGAHVRALQVMIDEFGLGEKIKLLGFVDAEKLPMFYKCADITVVPSIYEPFGMVVLEAMVAGCPVIVADTGGLKEIVVHEETGLCFKPGNPESLAQAMIRVLRDEGLAQRLTSDAQKFIGEKYNWGRIARHTMDVYQRSIKEYEYRPRVLSVCPPIPQRAEGS